MAGSQSGHGCSSLVRMPAHSPDKFLFHEKTSPDMTVQFLIRPPSSMSGVLCNSGEYDSELQAGIWCKERRLEEAKSEALDAASNFAKIGATADVERCRELLQKIEQEMKDPIVSGELLKMVPLPTPVNSPFSVQDTE